LVAVSSSTVDVARMDARRVPRWGLGENARVEETRTLQRKKVLHFIVKTNVIAEKAVRR
jgi:hypothetical protein